MTMVLLHQAEFPSADCIIQFMMVYSEFDKHEIIILSSISNLFTSPVDLGL